MATPVTTPLAAASIAPAILSLSKRAWKLGAAISKLDQYSEVTDTTVTVLTESVKSFGNECDLVYAELEMAMGSRDAGSPLLHYVDAKTWYCLETQAKETSQTMHELEAFVERIGSEQSYFIGRAQRPLTLSQNKKDIGGVQIRLCRHTDNLRTILLLINIVLTRLAPGRVDQHLSVELGKLQDMIEKLHTSSEVDPRSKFSHSEATLTQHAREVIARGQAMYEACVYVPRSLGRDQEANNVCVAEWVGALESIRQEHYWSKASGMACAFNDKANDAARNTVSEQLSVQAREPAAETSGGFEDDLETDIAKSALDTGAKAFEAQEWVEADSLLQEALQLLQQLPKQQRGSFDIFDLHYKLVVCAYHTQGTRDAEAALTSLVQLSASSDDDRICINNARHLLSLLCIRMGQIDRSRSECEKALQARRRLLGKDHNASLESTALMAHIYVLLNNRPRGKSFLAMIPESRRDDVVKSVEDSLGTSVQDFESSSLRIRSTFEDPDMATKQIESRLSGSTLGLTLENSAYRPLSEIVRTPSPSIRQPFQHVPLNQTLTVLSPRTTGSEAESMEEVRLDSTGYLSPNGFLSPNGYLGPNDYTDKAALDTANLREIEPPEIIETPMARYLSRKEILDRIGCHPRDNIEQAVCNGDHSALARLLDQKKDFWRAKFRKRVRPERLTALHFAALFGEMKMAQSLLKSNFNINDIPYGYTTKLSPLKVAIGSRQVAMVEYLITHGAKPTEPDTWSTLVGQLLSRSWLAKTLSEAEKEFVPNQITEILSILLRHGWNVSEPFESSGTTVLHQAVTFWTGSYRWDMDLRAAITSFLCEQGANPLQPNKNGKTPYDMALDSGDQKVLMILDQNVSRKDMGIALAEPVELAS